jgi:hypothetical protein
LVTSLTGCFRAFESGPRARRIATLECELLDRSRFETQAEAKMAIFDFIEGWYNPRPQVSTA